MNDEALQLLKDIQRQVREISERLAPLSGLASGTRGLREGVEHFRKEMTAGFAELRESLARADANVRHGFAAVAARIDADLSAEQQRKENLEARLKKLEAQHPPRPPPP